MPPTRNTQPNKKRRRPSGRRTNNTARMAQRAIIEKRIGDEGDKKQTSVAKPKKNNIKRTGIHLSYKDKGASVKDADQRREQMTTAHAQYLTKSTRPSEHANAIFDSGASHGLHWDKGLFTNKHKPVVTRVRGINNETSHIKLAGTCEGIHNVLHMPSCTQPIISVGQLLDQTGGTLCFTRSQCHHTSGKERQLVAERDEKGLYRTVMSTKEARDLCEGTADIHLSVQAQLLRERVHTLHRCLGHVGKDKIKQVMRRNNFTNLKEKDLDLLVGCDSCNSGKIKKANRPKTNNRKATQFGHTIVSDSTGRQATRTRGQKQYANVSVDEATRWCWVRLLRTLKHTQTRAIGPILRALGKVKTFRSDPGQNSTMVT